MTWLRKHWRDVALAGLLIVMGLTWWDEMRAAFLSGYSARCVEPW